MFLALWSASIASQFGNAIQGVGASWLMTSLDGSAEKVALVQAAMTLPVGLFALIAGAVADIYDRRRVMFGAQIMMLCVSALLVGFTTFGAVTPWVLLAMTFLLGSGQAIFGPPMQATVGEVVPRADLPGAVSLNILGFNVARSLGPALGGGIVLLGGPPLAFLVNALSYLGMISVLSVWRRPAPEQTLPRERIGNAILGGLLYASMAPVLRNVLLRTIAFGLCGTAAWALMPLVARDLVGGGPMDFGLLLGGLGFGAVLGALLSTRIRMHFSNETIVRAASVIYGLGCVVTAFSPWLWLTFAALVIGGAGWVQALSLFNVTMQMWAPRWVVGRALALFQTAIFGSMALGSWLWGLLAETHGLSTAICGSGLLMIALPLLGLFFSLPSGEAGDLEPLPRANDPASLVDLDPQAGPVVVTVEYRIAEGDIAGFQAAMAEKRRIRRRDGARRWTLLQDVQKPERWVERFHCPSWMDYLRHHSRATVADRQIDDRVRAFQIGKEEPAFTYLVARR